MFVQPRFPQCKSVTLHSLVVFPRFVHSKVGEMVALGLVELRLFLVSLHLLALGPIENLEKRSAKRQRYKAVSLGGTLPPSPESIATTVKT